MSVQAIRLKNFMAFADTGWIALKPITLLFGKNSSGKSTITRALRFLVQSSYGKLGNGPFVYNAEDGVDVANFENIVHTEYQVSETEDLSKRNPIHFGFRCDIGNDALLNQLMKNINRWRENHDLQPLPFSTMNTWVDYVLTFSSTEETGEVWLTTLSIECPWAAENDVPKIFSAEFIDALVWNVGQDAWYFHSDTLQAYRNDAQNVWDSIWLDVESGFFPTLKGVNFEAKDVDDSESYAELRYIAYLLDDLRKTIEEFLKGIEYVGPVRPEPQRVYQLDQLTREHWKRTGLRSFSEFLEASLGDEMSSEVDRWLQHMKLAYGVVVRAEKSFLPYASLSSILVYESKESKECGEVCGKNIVDCGFGLNQVLPVVTAAVSASNNVLLMIEQPEMHLYSGQQTALCDVFIANACRAQRLRAGILEDPKAQLPVPRERINDLRARFLIETHSEHTLLRLQTRIAASTQNFVERTDWRYINHEDAIVHFVYRDPSCGTSTVFTTGFGTLGEMKFPPELKDFFTEAMEEAAQWASLRIGIDPTQDEDSADDHSS